MSAQAATSGQIYKVRAFHIAERLRLREVRDSLQETVRDFSNYELIVDLGPQSHIFFYNYGSLVFFNVADEVQDKILNRLAAFRTSSEVGRTKDDFIVEVIEPGSADAKSYSRVFFDRVVVSQLTFAIVRTVSMLIAESTALEYYEIFVENLLEKTNSFSKTLENQGRLPGNSKDLVKFIGRCLNMKQEIISNLYIVDSPEETWENVDLDKLFQELKVMVEIDTRYRALEYKIRIIQESIELIVDLAQAKRSTVLEMIIIALIAMEIILSFTKFV
jgi:uncharacterized Rmd1/YagE family protein